jgi:teichuronic acid biosynthesis glycosyltransferase TuaC
VRILVAASNYPHAGHPFSGVFNERSVGVLRRQGHDVRVLVPRPYAPKALCRLLPRWRAYAAIPARESREGIDVIRPAYLQIPIVGGTTCFEYGAHAASRRLMRQMHAVAPFEAILAFGLGDAGALAWRLSRDLGVVAGGWATGGDVRVNRSSRGGRSVIRTLRSLDLVFYQSHELLKCAAALLETDPADLPSDRHMIVPRGIPAPAPPSGEARRRIRAEWGVSDDALIVLSISRVVRDKGILELTEAMTLAAAADPRVVCRVIGAMPALDDTAAVSEALERTPVLRNRMRLLPACPPEKVEEYLSAADIFAFPSHHEGMPNSLLEAMAMGVPSVAFGIPPVCDIAGGTEALSVVVPFDVGAFAGEIIRLAASASERARVSEIGKRRVLEGFSIERSMGRAVEELSRISAARTSRSRPVLRRAIPATDA